jgi:large subunit ribosomal protein L29
VARISEFRDLSDKDLITQSEELRDELLRLRFKHATGQLDNSARLGQVRKDVARVETLIREREIAAAEKGAS